MVVVYNSCYRMTEKDVGEKVEERRIDIQKENLDIRILFQTS